MLQVALADAPDSPAIDVCRLCHFVWFDANEIAALRPRLLPAAKPPPPISDEEREEIAMLKVRRLAEGAEGSDSDAARPTEWWKEMAAFFGLPVKFDEPI